MILLKYFTFFNWVNHGLAVKIPVKTINDVKNGIQSWLLICCNGETARLKSF